MTGYFAVTGEEYREGGINVDLNLDALEMHFGSTSKAASKSGPLPETIRPGSQHDELFREACRHAREGKTEEEIAGIIAVIAKTRAPNTPGMRPWDDSDFRGLARSASRYAPAPDPFRYDSYGDGEHFAALHNDIVRYDHSLGRWRFFDGVTWREDDQDYIRVYASEGAAARYIAAAKIDDSKARSYTSKGRETRRLDNTLREARAIPPLATTHADWNADENLIGAPNGTVDLETGEIRPARASDLISRVLGAPWDLDAKSELWTRVLERALPDPKVRFFLQQLAGITLGGVAGENVLPIIYGMTRTAKGTVLAALHASLGSYAKSATLSAFASAKDKSAKPRPDLIELIGSRMVAVFEAGATEAGAPFNLDMSLIKSLSGSDELTARTLYSGKMIAFRATFLVWFATDTRPRVPNDPAYFERLCEIPFNVVIPAEERDPKVRAELSTNAAHHSAILAWAFEGLRAYRKAGLLIRPTAVREAIEDARTEADTAGSYIDDNLVFTPKATVTNLVLRTNYEVWCGENGEVPESSKALAQKLKTRGARNGKINQTRGWRGVGLRGNEETL